MPDFADKVVLVVGGTSGIGKQTAISYAQNDAEVVVVSGRNEEKGEKVAIKLNEIGEVGEFIRSDVRREETVRDLVGRVVKKHGSLDIAVNSAGTTLKDQKLWEVKEKDWDNVLDTNLKGLWLCLKYEIRAMIDNETKGNIVNVGSVFGKKGKADLGPYVTSKHGVIGLTKTAALETSDKDININVVCPAVVISPMTEEKIQQDIKKKEEYINWIPDGNKLASPKDVSEAIIWLSSSKSEFVTGSLLTLDGGMLAGIK